MKVNVTTPRTYEQGYDAGYKTAKNRNKQAENASWDEGYEQGRKVQQHVSDRAYGKKIGELVNAFEERALQLVIRSTIVGALLVVIAYMLGHRGL